MSEQANLEESNILDPSSVIIIHPGSKNLRIGRASDSNPKTILHALAKRRRVDKFRHSDPPIVPRRSDANLSVVENCRNKLISQLQKSIRSDGRKRVAPPSKKIAEMNAFQSQQPNVVNNEPENRWLDSKSEFVIGDDVLRIHPTDGYNIHFPYKRGEINVHEDVGGSQTSILADLGMIWTHAIETLLEINRRDFEGYKVVLVISALYNRSLIKHFMTLLLKEIGFGQAFVLQDHVAATFGAGLGYGCVVDVGDQKTSISCVEDGISHPDTRINLDYGGSDVTQVFHYMLEQIEFPYTDCSPSERSSDAQLLDRLKKDNCHLDFDICGTAEKRFKVASLDSRDALIFTVYLSDECILAPMAYFHTELFELTRDRLRHGIRYMGVNAGDPEDPHDHIYLSETSRKYTKAGESSAGDNQGDPDTSQVMEDELDIINEDTPGNRRNSEQCKDAPNSILMPLDQAILKSIEACPSEEMKKKMYSSVLVVGGGFRFRMAEKFLTQRLARQIPPTFQQEPMEVLINPKGIPADESTWKGAAILSCLGSAQELWISPTDWSKHGQKILREKAPFPWT